MKPSPSFLVPATALEKALGLLKPYVPAKSSISILRGVQITAKPNAKIDLSVTNMECAVTYEAKGTVFHGGSVVVRHSELQAAVKAVKGSHNAIELHVNEDKSKVQVKGSTSVTLETLPNEDYPPLPWTQAHHMDTIYMQGESLLEALAWTVPAMSDDQTRPVLATLNLDWKEGVLDLQATDSYRLHTTIAEVRGKTPLRDGSYMLPAWFVKTWYKQIVKVKSKHVGLGFVYPEEKSDLPTGCCIRAEGLEEMVWRTRVVDGQYPKVAQLVPGYDPGYLYCVLEKSDYEQTLASIVKLTKRGRIYERPLRLTITRALSTENQRSGDQPAQQYTASLSYKHEGIDIDESMEISIHIPGETEAQFPFAIGLNPEFLRDVFACRERVGFQLISPLRPLLVNPDLDLEKLGLLMPVRLNA